jgi:hypothetical protein
MSTEPESPHTESEDPASTSADPDPTTAAEATTAEAPPTELSTLPDLPPPPVAAGFLLTIGDIGITADSIVTANGNAPLAGSQWIFTDRTNSEQKIPSWAIVMAIIFTLACLIGLFFLLVKETRITGYAEVSVRSGSLVHMTQLPVRNEGDIARYRGMVAQAQSLAASAAAAAQ